MKKKYALFPVVAASALVAPLAALAVTGSNGTVINTKTMDEASTTLVNVPEHATCYTPPGPVVNKGIPNLAYHDGKVYYGMGMAGTVGENNTESRPRPTVSYFDLASKSFGHGVNMEGYEVSVFREFDGDLYVPNVNPNVSAFRMSMYATNKGGAWNYEGGKWLPLNISPFHTEVTGKGVPATSIADVAKVGDTILMAGGMSGSADWGTPPAYPDGKAAVWSSDDGGDTWVVDHEEVNPDLKDRGNKEAFRWLGMIGDTVYARAEGLVRPDGKTMGPLVKRDAATGQWTAVPGGHESLFPAGTTGKAVTSWKGRIWVAAPDGLNWFDGERSGHIAFETGWTEVPEPPMPSPAPSRPAQLEARLAPQIGVDGDTLYVVFQTNGHVFKVDAVDDGAGDHAFDVDPTYFAAVGNSRAVTAGGGYLWSAHGTNINGSDNLICATPLDAVVDLAATGN